MTAPSPKTRRMADIKSRLLSPATTNNYEVFFGLPTSEGLQSGEESLLSYIQSNVNLGIPQFGNEDELLIMLSCTDTSLPGTSFATHELTNDRPGITEKHVYRRQYDGQIDFTFMVDSNYKITRFFELWMGYIIGQDVEFNPALPNASYRVKFPKAYKTSALHVTKFEKDNAQRLSYTFTDAFPLSISSTPVSYGLAELLKVTVTMSYTKYYINGRGSSEYISPFGYRLDNLDLNKYGGLYTNTDGFIDFKTSLDLARLADLGQIKSYDWNKPILSRTSNIDFSSGFNNF